MKEEGHSSRRESLAPGAVLQTWKCISSARQGRQVFRGPVEVGQMVSWAEVERRLEHEGWNTEAGSAVRRGFCWGRKRAHEDSGWSNLVAGPGGLGPGWLVSSAAGRMCSRTLALGRCRVALEGTGDSTPPCPDCAKHREEPTDQDRLRKTGWLPGLQEGQSQAGLGAKGGVVEGLGGSKSDKKFGQSI